MKLHPRIKELYEAVEKLPIPKALDLELLRQFKVLGATQTEAIITLHMGLNIPLKEAEQFVFQSRIWEPEEINDIAYQTFTYLYYDG